MTHRWSLSSALCLLLGVGCTVGTESGSEVDTAREVGAPEVAYIYDWCGWNCRNADGRPDVNCCDESEACISWLRNSLQCANITRMDSHNGGDDSEGGNRCGIGRGGDFCRSDADCQCAYYCEEFCGFDDSNGWYGCCI